MGGLNPFKKPKQPKLPPPPAPPAEDPATTAAAEAAARKQQRAGAGRASTVLTGPMGTEEDASGYVAKKKLFGE